jgi:hypothetical protein
MSDHEWHYQTYGVAIRITDSGQKSLSQGGRGSLALMEYQIRRTQEKRRRQMERDMARCLFTNFEPHYVKVDG